jgi:hypothetical protein
VQQARIRVASGGFEQPPEAARGEQPVLRAFQVKAADQLFEQGETVEVDPFAHQVLGLVEDEVPGHSHPESAAGGRDRAERAAVRAKQPELDDHRVVAVPQGDDLVVLVREGDAGVVVVAAHGTFAIVHGHGRDQLVVRVREG